MAAETYEEAIQALDEKHFDLCFFDLSLKDNDENLLGLDLVKRATQKNIYNVVMSSHEQDSIIEKAYEHGTNGYFVKGNEKENIGSLLSEFQLSKNDNLIQELLIENYFTKDPETLKDLKSLASINALKRPLLITGPSGVGKSSLAKSIHKITNRLGKYTELDCSTVKDDLLESKLFGHKKGSFTGAISDRTGVFEECHDGTLFIDEIGTLTLEGQKKFLHFLQTGEFTPVGGNKALRSSVKVIAGTNEDLQSLIKKKSFREDLYYRISGHHIALKPLCERRCDILPLIKKYSKGKRRVTYSTDAKKLLQNYSWNGNIRELINFTEYVTTLKVGQITELHIQTYINKSTDGQKSENIFTQEQYEYALESGLQSLLKKIRVDITQYNSARNNNNRNKVRKDLKLSSNYIYSKKNKTREPQNV
jgi:DNA-binding NtrC family response regulator